MGWLINLFGGTAISTIADDISKALVARQSAETEQDRIAADTLIATLQAQQATMRQLTLHWWTALPMILMALTAWFYFAKVVVWDSCLGLGSTPVIHGAVGDWMGIIITSTFGVGTAGVAGVIMSRFGGK